ncbi:MAG: hypothetical protein VX519_04785 [Myxococcota bacterium]|nr:hypothetical protein [Myxococcota bacterium]
MFGLWFLLIGCGGVSEEVAQEALVQEFTGLESCDLALFSELSTACRLMFGIESAASGDDDAARLACRAIRHEIWRDECHLRVAQELGRVGRVELALRHCTGAGDFQEICVTQISWLHPRWDARVTTHFDEGGGEGSGVLGPTTPGAAEAIESFTQQAKNAISTLSGEAMERAFDQVVASAWFNVYYGSGNADPGLARNATGKHVGPAHTAFALEAVRLLSATGTLSPSLIAEEVRQIWSGATAAPDGRPIDSGQLKGRFSPAVVPDGTSYIKRSATWRGGRRLQGESVSEDLDIAIVEALFFNQNIPVMALLPWLEDDRDRVRWTAARLYAQVSGKDDSKVQELLESKDSVLTNMVWKALVVDTAVPGEGLP